MNGNGGNETALVPHKSMSDFYRELERRYVFHKKNAEKHVKMFKPLGFLFGLAIPILSALVTFSISSDRSGALAALSAAMGLALTVLTILNSVLKVDERFARGAQHCIALHEWKRDFDILVAESDTQDEKVFHAMIREMDDKLSEIGKSMAEGWVPKPPS